MQNVFGSVQTVKLARLPKLISSDATQLQVQINLGFRHVLFYNCL